MSVKRIAIVGAGVVGKGMARLFEKRFEVVLYDVGGDKAAVNACDLAVVCVPTPMKDDGSCDIGAVEEVVSWIESPLILIKSTIPPGTTAMLRTKYSKKINFSPEYMGESKYFTPFWKYPDPERAETHTFVIVGGGEASEILSVFTKVMSVDTHFAVTTAEEAELTKYMENSFFAMKVSFCNEFYDIAKKYSVDYKRLRELWLLDSRINPNHTLVFDDDRGWGGKCYPKDLNAIIAAAEKVGYDPILLKAVVTSNKKVRAEPKSGSV